MACSRIGEDGSQWRLWASGAVGVALVGVAAYLIYRASQEKTEALAQFHHDVTNLDPAKVKAWQQAQSYEKLCGTIRDDYVRANTQLFREAETYWVDTPIFIGDHTIWIPQQRVRWVTHTRWVNNVSANDFFGLLRRNQPLYDQLSEASSLVGRTGAEAFESIVTDTIAKAGPSPIPVRPVFAWNNYATAAKIAAASLVAVGGLVLIWRQ